MIRKTIKELQWIMSAAQVIITTLAVVVCAVIIIAAMVFAAAWMLESVVTPVIQRFNQ